MVEADVDLFYSDGDPHLLSTGRRIDPIVFDPTAGPVGDIPEDVDPDNLSATNVEGYCALMSSILITTETET